MTTGVLRLDAADLVATAGADTTLAELDDTLAAAGVWVALDPPGSRGQSLGSALERGAGGPLAALFGPPRDQVIGLAFTAGDGTAVRTGGRVVKNVAGFDLAKLVVGGHGAYGRITEAHLRLRARPVADRTRAWTGRPDEIEAAAARLMGAGAMLAAFEVVTPDLAARMGFAKGWLLVARALGTAEGADEELEAAAVQTAPCREVAAPREAWSAWRDALGEWPVTARIGADPSAWHDAARLAKGHGASACSATIPRGTVRVRFGTGMHAPLRALRDDAAGRGWPVTLEHADDATMRAVGVWGAMEGGSLRIARALRAALGPHGTQEIPLWA